MWVRFAVLGRGRRKVWTFPGGVEDMVGGRLESGEVER